MKKSILVACFISLLTGCTNPTGIMSTVTKDMKDLLADPNVQKTLQSWETRADVTNPAIGFRMITGGEIYGSGIIIRGSAQGSTNHEAVAPTPAPTTQPGTPVILERVKIDEEGKPQPLAVIYPLDNYKY